MEENYNEEVRREVEVKNQIDELNALVRDYLIETLTEDGQFKEYANRASFNEILDYKPISIEELTMLNFVTPDFSNAYGYQITNYINEQVTYFLSKFDFLERIKPEIRTAMEIVYYRNIVINKSNTLLNRGKNTENEIYLNSQAASLSSGLINNIFAEVNQGEYLDISKFQDKAYELVRRYEDTLITDKVSKLYLALGTATGKIGELTINAPLLFIPVSLSEDENEDVIIEPDFERKIQINVDLIIANNLDKKVNTLINWSAFNEIKSYGEFDKSLIISEIKKFYLDNGIDLSSELNLKDEMSLGFYDYYKNPTQIDLHRILSTGFITDNIQKMFTTEEDISKRDELEGTMNEEAQRIRKELIEKREYDVSYISKINFPQDRAVKGSKIYENIVIQGPPGTGKTEVITSIISDAVIRGLKVLVSSEKLVALDVIKSRLGELAQFAILFNKTIDTADFYDQINLMLTESVKDRSNQRNSSINKSDNEIIYNRHETRQEIIEFMKSYQTIFEYLKSNEIGKTYSWLYKNHSGFRSPEPSIKAILEQSTVADIIKQNRLFVPKLYDVLFMINQKFSSPLGASGFDSDKAALSRYPFLLTHTKRGLTTNKINKALTKLSLHDEEDLFNGNDFSLIGRQIMKMVFVGVKHLPTYIKTKSEMVRVVELLGTKLTEINNQVDSTSTNNIFNSLGNAWLSTYEQIVNQYKERNKSYDSKVISNTIFDWTIKQILEFREASNTELQRNISNGNINSFNQMISKNLSEIVEKNITLAGRKLRDSLLDTLIASEKMLEIQSFTEHQKSRPVSEFMDKYWQEIFAAVNIWLLPADTVPQFFPLVPKLFDIVIIDEASQLPVEKAIPLLYRAKRLVVSGDDKQLKPSVNPKEIIFTDVTEYNWDNVILPPVGLQDALKNKYANYLLNYHYRSEYAELISFSNSFFYNKSLYVSTPKGYLKENPPVNFIKVKGKNVKGKNALEASAVIKEVIKLIETDDSKTIGIVAFTRQQKAILEEKLAEAAAKSPELDLFIRTNSYTDNGEDTSLFIKNVSEVQGDERDIIIFSTAFAPDDSGNLPESLGDISLENGENRLNVAITRAKSKLVVISSINPNDLNLPKSDRGGELFKHFLYYAEAFEAANEKTIRSILKLRPKATTKVFESRMHEEIFNLIKSQGYNIEYQYGFDNYIIDFVIKNEKGNVILGINLDNEQYLRNFNTMEREYYLPTYLEARGWNIIKVWSHQWSKNPDLENQVILNRIKEAIESFESGSVISLFDRGHVSLDFNTANFDYANGYSEVSSDVIDEGVDIIDARYKEVKALAKKILSEKHQAEEKKWLREYEAIEAKGGADLEEDLSKIIDKEFRKAKNTKTLEGIEDPEIDELIKLSAKEEEE